MACFLVPAAEAVITTAVYYGMKSKGKNPKLMNVQYDRTQFNCDKKSEETESVLSNLDELKQNLFSCLSEFNSNISDSENIDDIRYYLTELYKKIENIMEEKNDGKNYT